MIKKVTEFPIWKGYDQLENMKQLVRSGCYNDPKEILEYAAKMTLERIYFKDLLLWVQYKIIKHYEEGEGLGIGIDSSREFEDLMIVPEEDVTFPEIPENDKGNDKGNDEDKYERFVKDMEKAEIDYDGSYMGRFFYHGPAVRTNEKGFPTLQDVIRATKVKLQWDNLGFDFIIYPA